MLAIQSLEVSFGAVRVLRQVSFIVKAGQIVALLGANGAGKTTALRAISGLVPVASGKILLEGEDLVGLPPHAIVRRGLALCQEGRRLFANLTVYENLLLGGYARHTASRAEDLDWVLTAFPRLGERLHQRAGTLSGGEQQMAALGRALMSRPRLLLLDEPSLGLAPLLVAEVFRIITEVNRRGTTILLVEQNAHTALNIAQYAYVLENGRLVLQGGGKELLHHPHLQEAYLGGSLGEV
jgi:branched-chain amino acid transport system ATP-binding protein|uniref:ABC transporter ATP-binding protein n=1 Tax=Desulfobacca acetoxidans TaxID=60893 RepID=A0A7C3V2R7_9BACT